MADQPARALRHVTADEQDGEAEDRSQAEGEAPAILGVYPGRIQKEDAHGGSQRGTDPEGAVDAEIDRAAHARGDELVDRRVDRGVFAADAEAGQEAAEGEGDEVERE